MPLIVGVSFAALTVSTKLSVAERAPSLTVIVIVAVPDWLAAGVTVTVRFAVLPPSTTFAVGTRVVFDEVRVTVRLPAAVSASPMVKAIAPVLESSLIVRFEMLEIVGAEFTALTVTTNVSLAVSEPSLTVTVIVAEPVCPLAGVTVTVRLAPEPPRTTFAVGTSVVFDEDRVTVRLAAVVSMSPTVNASAPVFEPALIVWFAMSEIVGAAFEAGGGVVPVATLE